MTKTEDELERVIIGLINVNPKYAKLAEVGIAKSQIRAYMLSQFMELIGEDEEGEMVQIPCPDLKPGCLVYHTALRMTPEVKYRNGFRHELKAKAKERYGKN